jgi:protein-export SecD/SecF family membrane protein
VNLEFNANGTNLFADLTAQIAGTPDQIAIILDGVELIAPVVNQPITSGTAFIQGPGFTFERVADIALLLEGGRLPIPIVLDTERDVDAILGADSLRKSTIAGAVGLALVLLFMVAYYRAAGLVAAIALTMYAMLLLAVFKMLPVTLTLSGIAAAILSVGMAVDANILIFERMKEELRLARDSGRQRVDTDHVRHPVLVRRHPRRIDRPGLRGYAGHGRGDQHVLSHNHQPHAPPNNSGVAAGQAAWVVRALGRQGPAAAGVSVRRRGVADVRKHCPRS